MNVLALVVPMEVTASRNWNKTVAINTKHEAVQTDVTASQNSVKELKQWILSYFVSLDEHYLAVFNYKNMSLAKRLSFEHIFQVKVEWTG